MAQEVGAKRNGRALRERTDSAAETRRRRQPDWVGMSGRSRDEGAEEREEGMAWEVGAERNGKAPRRSARCRGLRGAADRLPPGSKGGAAS